MYSNAILLICAFLLRFASDSDFGNVNFKDDMDIACTFLEGMSFDLRLCSGQS